MGIRRPNSKRLSCAAWACNTGCPSIAVGCGTQHHGSNGVTVANGICQPLHDDRAYRLRLYVSVRGHIEGVTQRGGLDIKTSASALLFDRSFLGEKGNSGSGSLMMPGIVWGMVRWLEKLD